MKIENLKNRFFSKYNLLTILGPTASGKTSLAAHLAYEIDGEIISADSRQVYRGMDIGTGKDLDDYIVNGKKIPYHLIDILPAGEKYNLFQFQKDFFEVYSKILERKKIPILCGGSALYIDAIVRNYKLLEVPPNPELRAELEKKSMDELIEMLKQLKKLHNKTEIDTKKRVIRAIEIELYNKNHEKEVDYPTIHSLVVGLRYPREMQRKKIAERLEYRLKNGMIQEVENLISKGVAVDTLLYYGLEYKYITLYLMGVLSYEQMVSQLRSAISKFAKRQMTFFRRMERMGVKIHWLDAQKPIAENIAKIKSLMV